MKTCNGCGRLLPLDAFHKDHFSADGRKKACRDCQNARYRLDVRKRLVASDDGPGLVYFISESPPREAPVTRTARRYVKVGYTTDYDLLLTRVSDLQIGNPRPLVLLAVIEKASRETESFVHEIWADRHVRGEWFLVGERTLHFLVQQGKLRGFKGAHIRVMGDVA